MEESPPTRGLKLIFFIVFIVEMGLALYAHFVYGLEAASYDAVARTGVGLDLLRGLTQGRQGFIGSLFWAPLPTLLILPFLPWPALAHTGVAASLVAAASLAALCACLVAWWDVCRAPRSTSVLGVIVLCASPYTFWSVASGHSVMIFALLAFGSMALTIRWLETRSLRSLAYLAIALGLLILTRFQAVILVAAITLLVVLYLVVQNPQKTRSEKKSYAEATLIVFLAPAVYAFLVWLAANWLIMGDPLFFMRGLFPSRWPVGASHGFYGWWDVFGTGAEWPIALIGAILVGLPWLASYRSRAGAAPSEIAPVSWRAGMVVLFVCATVFGLSLTVEPAHVSLQRDPELPDIVDYIVRRHAEDRVVIAGYRGYDIIRRAPASEREIFVHTLSFYLGQVLHDTRGKRLYLLLPRPAGADRWEDIHLKYPEIYERGVDWTVFEKGWKNWQLLEVVRTDQ